MIRHNKKGFLPINDVFAVLIIALILFLYFIYAGSVANNQVVEIKAAKIETLKGLSMINYLKTPIEIKGQTMTISDLIIEYESVENSATSIYTKDELKNAVTQKTTTTFNTLLGEEICYELIVKEETFIKNNAEGCKKLSRFNIDLAEEKITLPNKEGSGTIQVYFKKGFWK